VARRSEKTKARSEDEELELVDEGTARGIGGLVPGARLEPIRYVERELTRPDGSKLRVKVPVYPPFRLEERPSPQKTPPAQAPPRRKAS
jgi:hypothetical protein